MIRNARLTVRDWNGVLRHERYLDHADPALRVNIPADGIEAWRTGHGGCLEMTFRAIWHTLRAEERDLLELDTQDGNGAWTRRYAGVLVKSGNSQVTWAHTNFKATGLKKRLTEVRVVRDVQEGDIGAQVRQALLDVLGSGDLGQGYLAVGPNNEMQAFGYTVLYDSAMIPNTGTLLGGFPARGRVFADLLDYLAAQAGCVWDVDADRKLFFRKAGTGAITLTEGPDVIPTYEDTDSEALVTRVLLNIGKWNDGTLVQYPVTADTAAQHGVAVGEVTLDPSTVKAWRAGVWQGNAVGTNTPSLTPEQMAVLVDGQSEAGHPALSVTRSSGGPFALDFVLAAQAWRIEISAEWSTPPANGSEEGFVRVTPPGSEELIFRPVPGPNWRTLLMTLDSPGKPFPAGTVVKVHSGGSDFITLRELRPESPNTAILNPLAAFHMVTPRRDPATVTVRRPVTPQPTLRLMRTDGTLYETTTESVGLHIKLEASDTSVIKAGQREPAEVQAKRWLDTVALAESAMTAVRFGGSR